MLLALDSSTSRTGLALYDGVQVVAEFSWVGRGRQTAELAPALTGLLARTGLAMSDIQALGVALGPGSFTSLRVGLALAKGLALARRLPLVGIPTLDVTAAVHPPRRLPLAAVLQAGRGRLAVGWYRCSKDGWQAEGPAQGMGVDELAQSIHTPTIVCGELTADERQRLARKRHNIVLPSPAQCLRRPAVLAELAWQRWQAGEAPPLASLAPIYLHVAGAPLA
ncbi:MAG: tRNA (adenosine(37)-N6)-threonylcarbamoyltransferase complex dimerization subunit type 1 TsaB [Chloroflexi bacterium]|nr:tRNA (adenosine(37)-N6)-threonylcarbamoyltransferase complex dimerization subunit type 1 TsaB [Chloroflexota bacterium]